MLLRGNIRPSYVHHLGKLSGCLSSYKVRRWCTFEWFYSAIDYPCSLGKPRRFSEHFHHEERQKLEQYRESVRKHFSELRTGIRDGLPTDLARPLFVGQRVIAIHPKSREVHDGSVLIVDHDKCRVQFHRPELGVEFVMDIDCMPMNPVDNMPEAPRKQIGLWRVSYVGKQLQINEISNFEGGVTCGSGVPLEKLSAPSSTLVKEDVNHVAQTKVGTIDNVDTLQEAYAQPHHQAREADIRALSELTHALDKRTGKLPRLQVSADEYNAWCKPFMNSLIVKLLGKTVNVGFMRLRMERMWASKGPLRVTPLNNGYFLVSFSSTGDRDYALQEGPWMIL
ncbi:hypothetical protein K1719_040230 [Acacia pycnantha]|nr:hypothetical protein K1719_040230 [Acacia pycnantha]